MKRQFIRHPSSIPVEVTRSSRTFGDSTMKDIGYGGLSFNTSHPIKEGTVIRIAIPAIDQDFSISAHVVWNKLTDNGYLTGVEFASRNDFFKLRMIEQVCQAEQYRIQVWRREGRELSSEEAAMEWIEKYADRFPQYDLASNA